MKAKPAEANVIPMPKPPRRPAVTVETGQFTIKEFCNAGGSKSYRVDGYKRNGDRVRKNFDTLAGARAERIALETEWLQGHREVEIKATRLSEVQIALAESAFLRLGNDHDLTLAVDYWLRHAKQNAVKESPRIDEAVATFEKWVNASDFSPHWKICLLSKVKMFQGGIGNIRVCEITPEIIEKYLDGRKVTPAGKDHDRRAISRFFSFAVDRKQRWATSNPCAVVRVNMPKNGKAPEILSLDDCGELLKAAEAFEDGLMAPYVALCLFGGLRPAEARRVGWGQINLKDREIRLEGNQTKTGSPRVVAIDDTLAAWLTAYEGKPIAPKNFRKNFDHMKARAGFGSETRLPKVHRKAAPEALRPWTQDIMRHTAISHYFRKTGSYGHTAEQFGNSEAIIKKHYQGRVTSEDTAKFYALKPTKKGGSK